MKTTSLHATAMTALLLVFGSLPLLGNPNPMRLPLVVTDVPTGVVLDYGNLMTVTPDPDGIIRMRGFIIESTVTLTIAPLPVPPIVQTMKVWLNADINPAAGYGGPGWGRFEGYILDAEDNPVRVSEGFWFGYRKQVSESLWVTEAKLVGLFTAGPLAGVAVAFDSKIETWHPMFATGYLGTGKGYLLVPDSVELRPGKGRVGYNN
jgi:hypothetical protein